MVGLVGLSGRRSPRRTAAAVALVALLATGGSGCAGEQPRAAERPGHPTSSHGAHPTSPPMSPPMSGTGSHGVPEVKVPPGAGWNAADAGYLAMMVAHHRQALDLAELAPGRAHAPAVRRLAAGIRAGQGREIVAMATWLVGHGLPEPTLDDVRAALAGGMPGVLTAAQVDRLAATTGAAFDRRFLQDMVQHHQGAVAMAQEVLAAGRDLRVAEWAADVVAAQSAEITRMRDLLRRLPG